MQNARTLINLGDFRYTSNVRPGPQGLLLVLLIIILRVVLLVVLVVLLVVILMALVQVLLVLSRIR